MKPPYALDQMKYPHLKVSCVEEGGLPEPEYGKWTGQTEFMVCSRGARGLLSQPLIPPSHENPVPAHFLQVEPDQVRASLWEFLC